MPKNKGENTKAVEARARKNATKQAESDRKLKAQEDAYWADDDKNLAKKQGRKDEAEKKRLEKVQRKNETKTMADEEMASMQGKSHQAPAKVTQAQIAAENERREAAARKSAVEQAKPPKPAPIVENLNRLEPEDEARTVDEALKMLTMTDSSTPDRHPERRVKAAYAAFEEARLPILKAENPSLRLSQLKQMIFAEWQKSPDNPLNKERLNARC